MLKELTEQDKNIFLAVGFTREWLKDAPIQVKEHLELVATGVKDYRTKYVEQQEVNIDLQTKYNELAAVSAGYLSEIQILRGQIDELLVEQQRPLHKIEDTNEGS